MKSCRVLIVDDNVDYAVSFLTTVQPRCKQPSTTGPTWSCWISACRGSTVSSWPEQSDSKAEVQQILASACQAAHSRSAAGHKQRFAPELEGTPTWFVSGPYRKARRSERRPGLSFRSK